MKKFAFILLSIVLCASMSILAVSADAVLGNWEKVSDTEYSVSNHSSGNNFSYYELGKSDEVTLSADIVTAEGPQQSFLLGVTDSNGDGKIEEGADQYYLVHFEGGKISVERNDKGWGGWAVDHLNSGVAVGETCTLKATYKNGTINVYANGTLIVEYGDAKTWDNGNTGFGLAGKPNNTTVTFKNVSVDTETAVNNTLGAGGVDVSKAEDNANWTVEGNKYTLNITENGYGNARFASYALGNSTKKVTITSKFTFGAQQKWGNDNGGDNGFLFAIADKNGDGKITEAGDYYYLVDVKADAGNVGIEKNQGKWGDWIAESPALGLEVGKEYEVSASYDPATGTIVVSVDGTEVLNWTDPNPLSGTGYAIASKTYGFVMNDVAVVDEAVPPVDTPDTPPQTGDMTVLAVAVATVALIGTGVIVSKKRRFN